MAQAAPDPAAQAAQAPPGGPIAPVVAIVGEDYRVEFSAGAWVTRPSTVNYSDTETITSTSGTVATTTTLNGSLVDFRSLLGLSYQTFPEGHLTVKIAPKQKLRGEYIPLLYKQTVESLPATIYFNGQTYAAGQTVESTYHWNEWKLIYEYDWLTFDRGFVGPQAALSSMNVSAATANSAQSGTASVNILMPGLGAVGRYYLMDKLSVTVDFLGFLLPGGDTSTHAHSLEIDGNVTYNFNKHVGAQIGVRAWDAGHVWNSPLNTGSITVVGPYVGGTGRF
ncbi:MAG TPA: hypothetical protein VLV86_10045 [Vicinamibacterales bacterium]|nr:hypothetical protein [Vicinamibacterales bacterium]